MEVWKSNKLQHSVSVCSKAYQYVIKKQIGPSRAFLEKKAYFAQLWPAQIAIQERVKEASLLLFFSGMQDRRKV